MTLPISCPSRRIPCSICCRRFPRTVVASGRLRPADPRLHFHLLATLASLGRKLVDHLVRSILFRDRRSLGCPRSLGHDGEVCRPHRKRVGGLHCAIKYIPEWVVPVVIHVILQLVRVAERLGGLDVGHHVVRGHRVEAFFDHGDHVAVVRAEGRPGPLAIRHADAERSPRGVADAGALVDGRESIGIRIIVALIRREREEERTSLLDRQVLVDHGRRRGHFHGHGATDEASEGRRLQRRGHGGHARPEAEAVGVVGGLGAPPGRSAAGRLERQALLGRHAMHLRLEQLRGLLPPGAPAILGGARAGRAGHGASPIQAGTGRVVPLRHERRLAGDSRRQEGRPLRKRVLALWRQDVGGRPLARRVARRIGVVAKRRRLGRPGMAREGLAAAAAAGLVLHGHRRVVGVQVHRMGRALAAGWALTEAGRAGPGQLSGGQRVAASVHWARSAAGLGQPGGAVGVLGIEGNGAGLSAAADLRQPGVVGAVQGEQRAREHLGERLPSGSGALAAVISLVLVEIQAGSAFGDVGDLRKQGGRAKTPLFRAEPGLRRGTMAGLSHQHGVLQGLAGGEVVQLRVGVGAVAAVGVKNRQGAQRRTLKGSAVRAQLRWAVGRVSHGASVQRRKQKPFSATSMLAGEVGRLAIGSH
eukprot:scaffold1461_cov253-Pinguiococcus_pyrenoidosus.AAC.23